MTDEQIQDPCDKCDVEPPAMRFKCPECEHNPDKEKFAKDINVPHKKQINDSLKNSDKNFNENCTVQKNERVIVMNLSDIIKDKDATIARLQSECNEKSDMIFKLMEQLHQINLRKEQIIIHGECVPVITLTRRQLEEDWYTLHQQLASKTQECDRYRNAIEEIEKIVNVDFSLPCARTACTYPEPCKDSLTENGTKCMRFALLKIKDIVNKAKDGKNEYTTNK